MSTVLLRADIDNIDEAILSLISLRITMAKMIGAGKALVCAPIKDPQRESEVRVHILACAEHDGLDKNRIEDIYDIIIPMCVAAQEEQAAEFKD